MILRVEVAISNKSVCIYCSSHIKRLEIRGIDRYGFICSSCLNFKKIIQNLRTIEKEFIRLNRLTKEEREDILLKHKIINKLR